MIAKRTAAPIITRVVHALLDLGYVRGFLVHIEVHVVVFFLLLVAKLARSQLL